MSSYAERYSLEQLSQKKTRSKTESNVTDNCSAITVGDRVEVENCPGHWAWASPFTVEAIDGEWAKLEMIGETIKIERLFFGLNSKINYESKVN